MEHTHRMIIDAYPIDGVLHGRCGCGEVREYPSNYDALLLVSNKRKGHRYLGDWQSNHPNVTSKVWG